MRFVVDTSAIVALIASEPDATAFHERLLAGGGLIAAATLVEVARVAMHRLGEAGVAEVRALIDEYEITIVEMDVAQAEAALAGMLAYAKGRGQPPAVLNFGDLFSYALAKTRDLPLLFNGDDFTRTDVAPALRP